MTSGRFALAAVVIAATGTLVATSGCGDDGAPCTDCPAMEGTWRMDFADAGVPAECVNLGVQALPQGEDMTVNRAGSTLTGTLTGVSLQGTVYASGDFSLGGIGPTSLDGGHTDNLNLTGLYTPSVGDGGTAALRGTFSGNYSRAATGGTPQRCTVSRPFTATRR